MAREPIHDPRLREMMEVCRPGRDDLADPEMAALARVLADSPELSRLQERLQRFDAAMADAFRDVAVPDGLESRILARVAAESAALCVPSSEPMEASIERDVSDTSVSPTPRTSRRRWYLAAGGLAAVAAAVLVFAFGLLPPTRKIVRSDLLVGAIECFLNESLGGQLSAPAPATGRYPFSTSLEGLLSGRLSVMRRGVVDDFLGQRADAFDLIGRGGKVGTVYAGSFAVEGLPAEVPLHPMLSTGETSASAWREGDVVYVLLVIGGERAYERLFSASAGPLT
jgi:hypothetical protein